MSWVAVGIGVVGAVGSYASAQSAEDQAEQLSEDQIKAQKELLQMKRDFELEDRKYRQGAVGNWAKFADPSLAPPTFGKDGAMTGTAPAGHGYMRPAADGQMPMKFQYQWPKLPGQQQ